MAIQQDGWSIVAQYRNCGKAGCKVCAEGRGHGPYYYGTKTVDGRRVSRYFGKDAPGEDTQGGTQETVVALRAELDTLRSENTRLNALVEELRGQLAKRNPSGFIEFEEYTEVTDTNVASSEATQDDDVHGLTTNQQAVLSALRQECEGDRWVTALSLGRRMGYPNKSASSYTLPVLRRLAALGYAEEIERNKFKPTPIANTHTSATVLVRNDTQELTRAEVEAMWAEESALIDANQDVLQAAHESFIRGLFRNTQDEHTRLRSGLGQRPYVCPFRSSGRGAHRTFASAERLVRTVVPWVVNNVAAQKLRSADMQRQSSARVEHHRERYQRMSLAELVRLHERMEEALKAGSNLGWMFTLAELEEQFGFVEAELKSRH